MEKLYFDLKRKEEIILSKNNIILAEVAASNAINKIRKNIEINRSRIGDLERIILDGVNFAEIGTFDIRSDVLTREGASSRTRVYQGQNQNQRNKTKLIQLFREFERYNNQDGITDADIERILESFLIGLNDTKLKESVEQAIANKKTYENYARLK